VIRVAVNDEPGIDCSKMLLDHLMMFPHVTQIQDVLFTGTTRNTLLILLVCLVKHLTAKDLTCDPKSATLNDFNIDKVMCLNQTTIERQFSMFSFISSTL